jgi:predicted site-specific integrase-resolvase
MKLSDYAHKHSICYGTAFSHFKGGKIKGAYQLDTGTIVVPDDIEVIKDYTVVYTRVSSSENKKNLETQAQRVCDFCSAKGWIVNEVIKECASGVNDSRTKLSAILDNPKVTRIVVEHKDRLTRFGFNYIKLLFKGEIIVINDTENKCEEDLMSDFISIITSFCARIYGKRRTRRKTESIIKELSKND